MKTEKFFFQYIPVDKELNLFHGIEHQSHDRDRSGSQIQKFFHIFRGSEREPCRLYLGGELFCLECFFTRHQKQVESCLLAVAEKQILTDMNPKDFICIVAVIHGHSCRVIHSGKRNFVLLQKVIA